MTDYDQLFAFVAFLRDFRRKNELTLRKEEGDFLIMLIHDLEESDFKNATHSVEYHIWNKAFYEIIDGPVLNKLLKVIEKFAVLKFTSQILPAGASLGGVTFGTEIKMLYTMEGQAPYDYNCTLFDDAGKSLHREGGRLLQEGGHYLEGEYFILGVRHPGRYLFVFEVEDLKGRKVTARIPIVVLASVPKIEIIPPENPEFFTDDDITLKAKVTNLPSDKSYQYRWFDEAHGFFTEPRTINRDEIELTHPAKGFSVGEHNTWIAILDVFPNASEEMQKHFWDGPVTINILSALDDLINKARDILSLIENGKDEFKSINNLNEFLKEFNMMASFAGGIDPKYPEIWNGIVLFGQNLQHGSPGVVAVRNQVSIKKIGILYLFEPNSADSCVTIKQIKKFPVVERREDKWIVKERGFIESATGSEDYFKARAIESYQALLRDSHAHTPLGYVVLTNPIIGPRDKQVIDNLVFEVTTMASPFIGFINVGQGLLFPSPFEYSTFPNVISSFFEIPPGTDLKTEIYNIAPKQIRKREDGLWEAVEISGESQPKK